MKMLELHILQSFPVACLNRDEVGSPKSAMFGGVQRARVSSQCWKRAIRELAKEFDPGHFAGQRTRYVITALEQQFNALVGDADKAKRLACATADALGKLDDAKKGNVKTLLFFSPQELEAVARQIVELDISDGLLAECESGDKKKAEKELAALTKKAAKELASKVKDAADIAIFGRMVADDHTLTVEGAGLFSHALSTHASANELDFFSAVDDAKIDADDAGAGHIGTLEFNSSCYYRYVGLNLGLLDEHLSHFSDDEKKAVKSAFLRAAILAVPHARKNSMFAFTPPSYVLGVRRGEGQPISLANAFENPVAAGGSGYACASATALQGHWKYLKDVYCIGTEAEAELPAANIGAFVEQLIG